MPQPPGDLPAPARAIWRATTAAVTAASAGNLEAFRSGTAALADCDPEQVRRVLSNVVRSLLEQSSPGGLAADDLRDCLSRSTRWAQRWEPDVDPDTLLLVLAGALGVHPEDAPQLRFSDAQRHAVLLTAFLLTGTGGRIETLLAEAFQEIRRAETQESA